MIGIKRLAITAHHAQTNGQKERYNQTLEKRLRYYVNEHQDNWDLHVQPLTYAYNAQVHRSTGTSPFSLILTRHPPSTMIETIAAGTNQLNDIKTIQMVRDDIVERISKMFDKTDRRMYICLLYTSPSPRDA